MNTEVEHLVVAPLLLPLLAGIALLLMRPLAIAVRRSVSVAAVVALLATVLALQGVVADGEVLTYALGAWRPPFGIVLVADRLAVWMLLITAVLALLALVYALPRTDTAGRHFHVLFQLQLFGLNGAFLTGDLFNLFVFFEVLLLASYGLLLHGGGAARTRAGLHFVVINLVGSSLFLFAAGTLYGVLGTLNMADLAVKAASVGADTAPIVRAAGLLLFAVFALKAALLPLHLWLPAAYAETSAPVAALFAIMTKVGAYGILRTGTLMFGANAGAVAQLYQPWLLPLALLTLLFGMLGVVASDRLRRQVAYLVVASVGSLLTAVAVGDHAGVAAALYYLPHSVFSGAAFFLLADTIAHRRGATADHLQPAPRMAQAPLLGSLFFLAAVLSAGMPPLSGFVGKFMTLHAAASHPHLPWILAVMLGATLLGVIAMARSGSLLFYRDIAGETAPADGAAPTLAPTVVLLGLCIALTIAAGPVADYTRGIATQLLEPARYINAVLATGGKL